MNNREIEIDGKKLKKFLVEKSKKQRHLAMCVGVDEATVSRWCKKGPHVIRTKNIKLIAECCETTFDNIISKCASDPYYKNKDSNSSDLTESEIDLLKVYRSLTPLNKAKARLEAEKIIQEQLEQE